MYETRRQEIADIDATVIELMALRVKGCDPNAEMKIMELMGRRRHLVRAMIASGEAREVGALTDFRDLPPGVLAA